MQEKEISMDEAMKVWWFVTWRTALTTIVINVIIRLINNSININTYGAEDYLGLILAVLVGVYFFKSAINRDYSSFRLSATPKKDK